MIELLSQVGVSTFKAQVAVDAPSWYHPGRSGSIQLGPKAILAHFGEIHPRVIKDMNMEGRLVAFELFLDTIPLPKTGKSVARPKLELSPFQTVERDFAFIVDNDITTDVMVAAANTADKHLIAEVGVFDLFSGVGDGMKSVAITVVWQPMEETLTDAKIDAVSERIVANVIKQTGGMLRS